MSKKSKTCNESSCAAYRDAVRTLSQAGQSAQVLYVEPNFIATPSEYDVFYDCFSSETDYPSERCRRNGMFCPPQRSNYSYNRRFTPKLSHKFARDCGGDGTYNFRNSLQQVAYTARILLKTFESSNNHRHYKQNKARAPLEPIADDEERVVTAAFQPGDGAADTKELHLDPYTVHIEPISLNIPLRIELRAASRTPYNTPMMNASYEAHISTGKLIAPMDTNVPPAGYCMEPIRTAIIAAPGPISLQPQQVSTLRQYETFRTQSRTSTSLWDANHPSPPPLPPFDYMNDDFDQYDNCALKCIKMAQQMYTNEKDTQVKTICGCCTSQVLFMPIANLKDADKSAITEDEKQSSSKLEPEWPQPPEPIQQTKWSQTSGLTLEDQTSILKQSIELPRPLQQAQASQTLPLTIIDETIRKSGQLEKPLHLEQSSQTSLIFDFEPKKEPPQFVPQESKNDIASIPTHESVKKDPSTSIQSAQLPKIQSQTDSSINGVASLSPQSLKTQSSIEEGPVSGMQSIIDETSSSIQSSQLSKIHSITDSSTSEPSRELQTLPAQASPPVRRSSQATQTTRTSKQSGRLSGKIPPSPAQTQERKEEEALVAETQPPIKTYRLAMPQHKFLDICSPCRYDPSPLIDDDGHVFCPYNCGCCLCPWRARPIKTEEERAAQEHGKVKICQCRDKGTIFTKFNENEQRCNNTEFFDFCPCREKAEAKHLDLYGEEMWTSDEHLSIMSGNRAVLLSEVIEINRNANNY